MTRVMRLKVGSHVALFNARDGEWRAKLTDVQKKSVSLTLIEQLRPPLIGPDVWVCFAPIKFGRIDYLVQKMTELGATKLQPTLTHYTQTERIKLERLRANAIEAAEQCERVDMPELGEPIALRQLLADWPEDRALLFADESGQGLPFNTFISPPPAGGIKGGHVTQSKPPLLTSTRKQGEEPPQKWAILIGPEGGFSPEERELIYSIKATQGVSLGPRILRADTAALTLLSLTMSAWGDWNIKPHYARGED
jgi:16S rRNA (uracil1498-N3)-methyltransferase